jgi:hypothetical protein
MAEVMAVGARDKMDDKETVSSKVVLK